MRALPQTLGLPLSPLVEAALFLLCASSCRCVRLHAFLAWFRSLCGCVILCHSVSISTSQCFADVPYRQVHPSTSLSLSLSLSISLFVSLSPNAPLYGSSSCPTPLLIPFPIPPSCPLLSLCSSHVLTMGHIRKRYGERAVRGGVWGKGWGVAEWERKVAVGWAGERKRG